MKNPTGSFQLAAGLALPLVVRYTERDINIRLSVIMPMTLSEELQWRNLIKDHTFQDLSWLNTPRTFYLGVDCSSADSLTIGNLAIFLVARRLQRAGWRTVLLVGGATSLIGDPGGKQEERQLISRDEIEHNVAAIAEQVKRLFSGAEFSLVDNYDWFKDVLFLEFLRDIGKHYNLSELMQRDFIADRMGASGNGISYAEFSYTLIQGYDFWHLYKNHGVELQIGGSDQWGNMLSGVPLIRKKENHEVHAFSMPLVINKATGRKFGKSEAGAIWLDPAKTSPTQFYQFWINCDDEAVAEYLKIYTDIELDTLTTLMQTHQADRQQRLAQTELARQVTSLVHGEAALQFAELVTSYLTEKTSLAAAEPDVIEEIGRNIPSYSVPPSSPIAAALVGSGLAASLTDARRLLAGNAISVNGRKITGQAFSPEDFQNGRLLLRRGKAYKDAALILLAA